MLETNCDLFKLSLQFAFGLQLRVTRFVNNV